MPDSKTTIDDLKKVVQKFMEEREWQQFHTPKNLSMLIATEAAELMELFLWVEDKTQQEIMELKRTEIEDEVADVAIGILNFCLRNNIDLAHAIEQKFIQNAQKYPIEKSKGNALKYDQL